MATLELNVGRFINGELKLSSAEIVRAITSELRPFIAGQHLYLDTVSPTSGEPTVAASLIICRMLPHQLQHSINRLCAELEQDCISGKYNGEGFLIGPKCADYGGCFLAEHWAEPKLLNPKDVLIRELIECGQDMAREDPQVRETAEGRILKISEQQRRQAGIN